jgi:hypothetical protein
LKIVNPHIIQTARLGLLLLCFAVSGCKSTDAAKQGSQEAVVIKDHTEEEVRRTTIEVFGLNGYRQSDGLNFEKQGTKWDTVKYGGLGGTPVWIKMSAKLTKQAEGYVILGCDTYVIEDRDDPLMREERKLPFGKRSDCKKILDQIKQRLSLPAASSQ